jgi:hypothetical protein
LKTAASVQCTRCLNLGRLFWRRIPHPVFRNPREGRLNSCPSDPPRGNITTVSPLFVPKGPNYPSAASCRPRSPLPSSALRQQRKCESGQRETVRRRDEARRCSPRSARSSSGRRRTQIRIGTSCFSLRIDYPWYQILLDPNLCAQLLRVLMK